MSARLEIYDLIRGAVQDGAAVLLVSSEFEEIEGLCDRALILHRGVVVGEASGDDMSVERLEHLAHHGGDAS